MKTSSFVKFFVLAVFITAGWNVAGKTVEIGFLTGNVVAAEISTVQVNIINREKYPHPNMYDSPAYAVVVFKMNHNRSISHLDYSLVINNVTAECIAAAYNMDTFVVNTDTSNTNAAKAALFPGKNEYVRLLFVFDSSKIKINGSTVPAVLKANLSGRSNINLKLSNLGNGVFTDVKNIPADGLLK